MSVDEKLKTQMRQCGDVYAYIGHCGKFYESPPGRGSVEIPVLQFLVGLPMDNLAMAFFKTLNPTIIRISSGAVTTDTPLGTRLTVIVEPLAQSPATSVPGKPEAGGIIKSITLECSVGYGCGSDMMALLRERRKEYGLPESLEQEVLPQPEKA